MPLAWDEVKKGLRILDFTLRNALNRLEARGDLFQDLLGAGIDMQVALEKRAADWEKK